MDEPNRSGAGCKQGRGFFMGTIPTAISRCTGLSRSARVWVMGNRGGAATCPVALQAGGKARRGIGLAVCVQGDCRLVAEVAPAWVAHVESGGGA